MREPAASALCVRVRAMSELVRQMYASCHSYDTDDGYYCFFLLLLLLLLLVVSSPSSPSHTYTRAYRAFPLFHFIFGVFPFLWTDSYITGWTIWLRINHTSQTKTKDETNESERGEKFMSINFNVILFCWPQLMNRSCWDNSNVMYNSHSDGFYMGTNWQSIVSFQQQQQQQ